MAAGGGGFWGIKSGFWIKMENSGGVECKDKERRVLFGMDIDRKRDL